MKKMKFMFFAITVIYPLSITAQKDTTKINLQIKPITTYNPSLIATQKNRTDTLPDEPKWRDWQGTFDELSLIAGYSINKRNEKNIGIDNHIFEIGLYKSKNSYYTETAGYSYYFSNEFMFNKYSFYAGPKIGGFFHVWALYFGLELVYYTDFKGEALHFVPIVGVGNSHLKIGIGFHIPLVNNIFEHTNIASIGFTYQIKNFKKKKLDL